MNELVYCPTCGLVYNRKVATRCVYCPDQLVPITEPALGSPAECHWCGKVIVYQGTYIGWLHDDGSTHHRAEPNPERPIAQPSQGIIVGQPEPIVLHNQPPRSHTDEPSPN